MLPPRIFTISVLGGGSPAPLEKGSAMLEEKTHTITCRLNEVDFQKLKCEAEAMDVNASDYIRLLTRLPVEVKAGDDPDSYIIIDPKSVSWKTISI